MIGVVIGFAVACLLASLGVALLAPMPSWSAKFEYLYYGIALAPLVFLLCLGPAVLLRFALYQFKPYRAWKFMLAGCLLGAAFAALFTVEAVFWIALSIVGSTCGFAWFTIEVWARRRRLAWMQSTQDRYPGWRGKISEELCHAKGNEVTQPNT
jgi:uncharacterized membrane protein